MPCRSGLVKPRTYCKPAGILPLAHFAAFSVWLRRSRRALLGTYRARWTSQWCRSHIEKRNVWALLASDRPTLERSCCFIRSIFASLFFGFAFFANRDPSDADLTTRMSKSCQKSTAPQPQHDFAVQRPRRPPHVVPFEAHFGASCRQLSPTLFA